MFSTHTLCVKHSYNSLSLIKSYQHTILCVYPISNISCVLVNRSKRKKHAVCFSLFLCVNDFFCVFVNATHEYIGIVNIGFARPSKPMHYFKTGIKV